MVFCPAGGPMTSDVNFNVLGAWEVRTGSSEVTIPPGQLRTLLAALLLSVDEPVPMNALVEQLWPERLPARPQSTLHTYVTRLRKLLGHDVIQTVPGGGYQIRVPTGGVDLHRFRDLVRQAEDADSVDEELALLREALRLWRGRPFGDVTSTWLDRDVVPRLTEEWFTATERRIDLELAAGQPGRLIAELWELTSRYPTRESLWLRLISALHSAGRRAEALDAYQQVRALLSDELGIDPGERLAQLQRAVLLDGTAASHGPVPAEPPARHEERRLRQLPHDIANFCGRDDELAALDALVAGFGTERQAPTIVAINGAAGTGKTTLAVHWAHRIAHRYPDVQLHLNLRGYGPGDPVAPSTAAETMLRALGVVSDMIPAGMEERSALLRTVLAGRQVLILLDNARDADQVRPLLPGIASLVVVTSRNQLRGLSIRDGAHRVTLHRLPERQALELLAAAIGAHRVVAEPTAAARLGALCDHLPLALAIVAERAHRTNSLAEVVNALEDEKARLDNLGTGENDPHTDLRAVLSWSYAALKPDVAAMFRKLGLHPANDIALETAAALADLTIAQARESLDQLIAAHMVEQRRPHRYELHDLIRLYATDQARRHEALDDRDAAVRRVLDWYLHAAISADRHLLPHRRRDFVAPHEPQTPPPEFSSTAEAMTWLEQEFDCLRSVTEWAAANGWAGHAWRTATAMTSFFDARIPWLDGLEFYEAAVRAAETAGDIVGEAYTTNALGCVHLDEGDRELAKSYFLRSLSRFQEAGHTRGEAMLLGNVALVYGETGDDSEAQRYSKQALDLCEQLDYPRGTALNLDNLGVAYTVAGDYNRAIECFQQAHAINVKLGEAASDAMNQYHAGRAYAGLGDTRRSMRAFREAISLYRGLGNRRWETLVLVDLGKMLHQAGHPGLAQGILEDAVARMTEFAYPRAQETRAALEAMGEA
jgi:DNA-binding SARP family transcriptional activator